jgi:hypothetical protein
MADLRISEISPPPIDIGGQNSVLKQCEMNYGYKKNSLCDKLARQYSDGYTEKVASYQNHLDVLSKVLSTVAKTFK